MNERTNLSFTWGLIITMLWRWTCLITHGTFKQTLLEFLTNIGKKFLPELTPHTKNRFLQEMIVSLPSFETIEAEYAWPIVPGVGISA